MGVVHLHQYNPSASPHRTHPPSHPLFLHRQSLSAPTQQRDSSPPSHFKYLLRVVLQEHEKTESLRVALEYVRPSILDVPQSIDGDKVVSLADSVLLRSEMHRLNIENVLVEDLRSLRLFERRVEATVHKFHPGLCEGECAKLYYASECGIGRDEYRVRGKTTVSNTAEKLHASQAYRPKVPLTEPGEKGIHKLSFALRFSLGADLVEHRRVGEAKLPCPRITDIPSFAVRSPHLMRGGQPNDAGVVCLKNCGAGLIIGLRGSDRGNQWAGHDFETVEGSLLATCRQSAHAISSPSPRAPAATEPAATTVLMVGKLAIEDFSGPSLEAVDGFVALVDAAEEGNESCFVCCMAGIGASGNLGGVVTDFEGGNLLTVLFRRKDFLARSAGA